MSHYGLTEPTKAMLPQKEPHYTGQETFMVLDTMSNYREPMSISYNMTHQPVKAKLS